MLVAYGIENIPTAWRESCYKYFKQQFVNFGRDPIVHQHFSHAFKPNHKMKMPHEVSKRMT